MNKNSTSEVSASQVETSGEMMQAMTLPNKSMSYDQPSGGGGQQTVVMVPPINNKGDLGMVAMVQWVVKCKQAQFSCLPMRVQSLPL